MRGAAFAVFVCVLACGSSQPPQPGTHVLVSGIDIPTALGVDGDQLVWLTQSGDLFSAPKSGAPISAPVHVADFVGIGSQLAFDESAIYVASYSDGVFRVDRATSEVTQIDPGIATAVATTFGGDVYWSTFASTDGAPSPLGVKRLAESATTPEVLAPGETSMVIALDSSGVYWIDGLWLGWCVCWDPCAGGSQMPLRQRTNDGTITTLGASTPYYGALAADGDALWASDWCAGTITRFEHLSGATVVVASGLRSVSAITMDDRDLYAVLQGETELFTDLEPSIVRVPKSGGAASPLPIGNRAPIALALDDTTVYFIAFDRATQSYAIYGLAKPGR